MTVKSVSWYLSVSVFVFCCWPVHPIFYGQKISILKVPWIVHGHAIYKRNLVRFAGVIIHERLVLTHAFVVMAYENITITAGVANLRDLKHAQKFLVDKRLYHRFMGVLQLAGERSFQFGPTVQRASLRTTPLRLKQGRFLYAAAWGSVNWNERPPWELHGCSVWVSYRAMDQFQDEMFMMTAAGHKNFSLSNHDAGGPVWDLRTGEVAGLIYRREMAADTYVHSAFSVGKYRKWIERASWNLTLPKPWE